MRFRQVMNIEIFLICIFKYLNTYFLLQNLPLTDAALITATSPIFTVFYARIFVKEPILAIDLLNVIFIICGMTLIVKPPFIFGQNDIFNYDSNATYALIALILGSIFLQPNVYVCLRLLKGFQFVYRVFN